MLIPGTPLGIVFLISLAVIFGSIEFGYRVGRRLHSRLDGKEVIGKTMLDSACLGLLSFTLAIVFGVAQGHHAKQIQLVTDEANAVSIASSRADLLSEPGRTEVLDLLREYANLRGQPQPLTSTLKTGKAESESQEIHALLWRRADEIISNQPTRVAAQVVSSMTELIRIRNNRILMADYRTLPAFVWIVLYGLAVVAMSVGGFYSGLSGSHRFFPVTITLSIAYAAVFTMIAALDGSSTYVQGFTEQVFGALL